VVSFQPVVKPAIGGEATSLCIRRTARGGWEQRAEKDMLGTWESHAGGSDPNVAAEHIRLDLTVWKSDAPIVAMKRVTTVERRGAAVDQQISKQGDPLG
jgi:hypothetical protein